MSSSISRSDYRNPIDVELREHHEKASDFPRVDAHTRLLNNPTSGHAYAHQDDQLSPPAGYSREYAGPCGGITSRIDDFFQLSNRNATLGKEITAGLASFLSCSYALFIVPELLSYAGIAREPAIVATCMLSGAATIIGGFISALPFICLPGLGVTACVVYDLLLHQRLELGQLRAVLVLASASVFLLSVIGRAEHVLRLIPSPVKAGLIMGVGLLLAFTGLQVCGVLIPDADTMLQAGSILSFKPLLTISALTLAAAAQHLRRPYAALLAVLLVAIVHPVYR